MSTLPKLNSDYKYQMTLPVSGTKHNYRPYLVKEEKALLMANESEERTAMALAMRDTLEACVEGADVSQMPLADMEYAFAQVRARSAGESLTLREVECTECGTKHRVQIDLLTATTTESEYGPETDIELQENWVLTLKWPTLDTAINAPEGNSQVDSAFAMISEMLVTLRTPDGSWDFSDVSPQERNDFIDSMNAAQLQKIREYTEAMPYCKVDISFTCTSCSADNEIELRGIENFFG